MEILYEDNHLLIVNKLCGELVQPDPDGTPGLEQKAKHYLQQAYNKPGEAFLGVVHRIDRPVSGVVLFAKTSKALRRLNEQLRERGFQKSYLAIVESRPAQPSALLSQHLWRNAKTNKSYVGDTAREGSKLAELRYELVGESDRYFLLRVELITGRHHQIRAQLAAAGCPIKGDVKYGARRSNPDGGISLHSHRLRFAHPVGEQIIDITAPTPSTDKLWGCFGI